MPMSLTSDPVVQPVSLRWRRLSRICHFSLLVTTTVGLISTAEPAITGVSGTVSHGQSITISGTGFGTKSPAAPFKWDNFEPHAVGGEMVADCGYINEDGDGTKAYIRNDRSYGTYGTKSARMDYAPGPGGMFPRIGVDLPPGTLEVFISHKAYYTRYAGPGSVFVFKWTRGGSFPSYSGNPRFYETIFSHLESTGVVGSTDRGYVTDAGTVWTQDIVPGGGQDANQWSTTEYHYRLSNPAGAANGAFEQWVNSNKNVDAVNVVTRPATQSSATIDYVMTPFDGADSYGAANGYYFWIDDYYVDITQARVEIAAGSTWATRGVCEIQPPTAWASDGSSVTVTVNQGMIPDAATRYLYVVDASGNVNANGYPITFNSPSGAAPAITSQPASQTVTAGATASFTVAASGSPTPTFQWRKNGTNIGGATATSYTTPATVLGDNGAVFSVVVTNSAGTATSSGATLTVNAPSVAPSITTQPANQTVTVGATATFTVVASGTPAPTYQWRKNGTNIGGATATSYTTPAAVLGDSGAVYSVVVSNSAGMVTSSGATLTVNAGAPTTGGGSSGSSGGGCGAGGAAGLVIGLGLMLRMRRQRH